MNDGAAVHTCTRICYDFVWFSVTLPSLFWGEGWVIPLASWQCVLGATFRDKLPFVVTTQCTHGKAKLPHVHVFALFCLSWTTRENGDSHTELKKVHTERLQAQRLNPQPSLQVLWSNKAISKTKVSDLDMGGQQGHNLDMYNNQTTLPFKQTIQPCNLYMCV